MKPATPSISTDLPFSRRTSQESTGSISTAPCLIDSSDELRQWWKRESVVRSPPRSGTGTPSQTPLRKYPSAPDASLGTRDIRLSEQFSKDAGHRRGMTKASQRSACSDSTGRSEISSRAEETSEEEWSWWLSDDLSQITGGTTRHSVSKALQENQKRGSMARNVNFRAKCLRGSRCALRALSRSPLCRL